MYRYVVVGDINSRDEFADSNVIFGDYILRLPFVLVYNVPTM